jgi:proteic killer suppression protein
VGDIEVKGIDKKMFNRILRRLELLDVAKRPEDMNVPGFDYHKLHGKPVRYSVHVNGPWCVRFEMDGEDATQVRL